MAGAGIYWFLHRGHVAAPLPTAKMFTEDSGASFQGSISADGKFVVYSSDRAGEGHLDLWLRQVQGGAPLRLTQDLGDEAFATFSPDGTQIAFCSERDGGSSIRIMPVLGGQDRLLAAQAKNPRFSPDGRQILYIESSAVRESLPMHLISVDGGEPRAVAPGYAASEVLWAADGRHILFQGFRDKSPENQKWYVTLPDGQPAEVGAEAYLRPSGISRPRLWGFLERPGDDPLMVFSGVSDVAFNLWAAPMAASGSAFTGPPERLTTSAESQHVFASVSKDGKLVFTGGQATRYIWMLPVDANSGRKTGERRRVTRETSFESVSHIAARAKRMVYFAQRLGANGVYVRDFDSGMERLLVPESGSVQYPVLNPDGTRVAVTAGNNEKNAIRVYSVSSGASDVLCSACGAARDWSPDGKWLLTHDGSDQSRISVVGLDSKQRHEILAAPGMGLFSGHFSPDGKWIAFYAREGQMTERLFIARFAGATAVPRSDWIAVTDGKASDNKPRWSPNGNLLYYTTDRGGGQSIFAQRLDPVTKKPAGDAFAVEQLWRGSLLRNEGGRADLSVAQDRLIFTFAELRTNLWTVQAPK